VTAPSVADVSRDTAKRAKASSGRDVAGVDGDSDGEAGDAGSGSALRRPQTKPAVAASATEFNKSMLESMKKSLAATVKEPLQAKRDDTVSQR
jgi:hypothetical protein